MTKEAIINKTVRVINQLPQEKATEISDFADFVIKKYEDQLLTDNIQTLLSSSQSFAFLNDEEDMYFLEDLIEIHNE
jgi:hypothetical protein